MALLRGVTVTQPQRQAAKLENPIVDEVGIGGTLGWFSIPSALWRTRAEVVPCCALMNLALADPESDLEKWGLVDTGRWV